MSATTPRTEKAKATAYFAYFGGWADVVPAGFARELESESVRLREKYDIVFKALTKISAESTKEAASTFRSAVDALARHMRD